MKPSWFKNMRTNDSCERVKKQAIKAHKATDEKKGSGDGCQWGMKQMFLYLCGKAVVNSQFRNLRLGTIQPVMLDDVVRVHMSFSARSRRLIK